MSQFVIATDKLTADQRNAITNHIKSKGWAFWHHFEDLWLVTTSQNDNTTSHGLFNELTGLPIVGKAAYMLVIRLSTHGAQGKPMTYFGFGPQQGWEWTKKYWGKVG
jgi:hypothetical protein